jgi:hypothetical protein
MIYNHQSMLIYISTKSNTLYVFILSIWYMMIAKCNDVTNDKYLILQLLDNSDLNLNVLDNDMLQKT